MFVIPGSASKYPVIVAETELISQNHPFIS